jgi:hypothetical protein
VRDGVVFEQGFYFPGSTDVGNFCRFSAKTFLHFLTFTRVGQVGFGSSKILDPHPMFFFTFAENVNGSV